MVVCHRLTRRAASNGTWTSRSSNFHCFLTNSTPRKGGPSIPPEKLLKARVLIALYSVRSQRLFCEQLGYNLLWLWFLDREFSQGSFDHSVFSQNYERVLSVHVGKLFFAHVYDLSRQEGRALWVKYIALSCINWRYRRWFLA